MEAVHQTTDGLLGDTAATADRGCPYHGPTRASTTGFQTGTLTSGRVTTQSLSSGRGIS
jgi:hypothetical protein